ncbi:protein lethal(2)essential for life-like [Limulus polyphemus]|uniref:Protein lethal(2)essential for life-like n=1 Tax=Limulus polyphemus TaxID=6850 RepID=A0ABM1C5L4_LIMPO|nr:protein lethal(2)essential for life-like [Limulus polyphemus]
MAFSRSLIPNFFGRDWWDLWDYPSQIGDQNFGLGIHDSNFLPPMFYDDYLRPRRCSNRHRGSGHSRVTNEKDKFQLSLDVNHFAPNEITVKTVGNSVLIEGKHEEKQDEHGIISRQFVRRYMLPKEVDPETVRSSLSLDGILTVDAPKKPLESCKPNERIVDIQIEEKETLREGHN